MNIVIRKMNIHESEQVAELTNQAYSTPYRPGKMTTRANDSIEKILSELSEGVDIFIIESENKFIGTVRCKIAADSMIMYKLAVAEPFRNQGIAGKLIQHIFEHSKSKNINTVVIYVAEAKGLILYYESFGFKITKCYKNKRLSEVEMSKSFS